MTTKPKGIPNRRSDVYGTRREKIYKEPRIARESGDPTKNAQGQFVGRDDVARGFAFFNSSRKQT